MEDTSTGRGRSPNYPIFGLAEAIQRVEALFKANGKNAVHAEAAVKAWGYNTLNGRSLGVLGALRQYGLIEYTGPKMVKPSQAALTILLLPKDAPQRKEALTASAKKPNVFSELFENYGEDLPSDDAMISHLTLSTSFSKEAATKAIASFRETLDLLNTDGVVNSSQKRDDRKPVLEIEQIEEEEEEELPPNRTGKNPKRKEGGMPDIGRDSLDIPFPIISGGEAVLRVPRTMTDADFTMLTTLISTMLNGMKAALVAAPRPPEGGEAGGG